MLQYNPKHEGWLENVFERRKATKITHDALLGFNLVSPTLQGHCFAKTIISILLESPKPLQNFRIWTESCLFLFPVYTCCPRVPSHNLKYVFNYLNTWSWLVSDDVSHEVPNFTSMWSKISILLVPQIGFCYLKKPCRNTLRAMKSSLERGTLWNPAFPPVDFLAAACFFRVVG